MFGWTKLNLGDIMRYDKPVNGHEISNVFNETISKLVNSRVEEIEDENTRLREINESRQEEIAKLKDQLRNTQKPFSIEEYYFTNMLCSADLTPKADFIVSIQNGMVNLRRTNPEFYYYRLGKHNV